MNAQEPRRIDLHNIYDQFSYLWDADTDQMMWPKASRIIFEDSSLFNCGDRYLSHLSEADFDKRLKTIISQSEASKDRSYACEYDILLPSRSIVRVRETGKVLQDQYKCPCGMSGKITVVKGPYPSNINDNEKNPNNIYLSASNELDIELAENIKKNTNSAYMLITIERLQHYTLTHGFGAVRKAMNQIKKVIEQSIRENDRRFRISGNSFSLILEDCGQAELLLIAHRIISKIEDANIRPHRDSEKISVSIGSALLSRSHNMTPTAIRAYAHKALMDAQDIRAISKPAARIEQSVGGKPIKTRRKFDGKQSSRKKRA